MKYFTCFICAIAFAVCLNGCAVNQTKSNYYSKMRKKQITFAQTLTAELAELAKNPIRTTVESRQEQARMEKDNSIVETSFDAFGNKTESRVFYNDALLKMVVLQTSANGQQQALIYGKNGEVKSAPQNLLDKVLTSVAGEIAKTVEIFEVRKDDVMLAKLSADEMPQATEFQAVNLNPPTAAELAPSAEVEPKAATVETPEKVSSPEKVESKSVETPDLTSKFRAAVQSLKADRSKLAAKNLTAATN